MKKIVWIVACICLSMTAFGQLENRLRAGQMYEPGNPVYAPRFGFKSKIPVGWEGTLPRESEIFVLMPLTAVSGTIYVFGTENDNLEALKKRWMTGADLGNDIKLKPSGKFVQRGTAISTEAELEGATRGGRKYYAEARCSEFGICIAYVMTADNSIESIKSALRDFVDNTTFEQPRNISIYEGFDWKKFLSDRMLLTYDANQDSRKLNEVHFCQDGTFYSDIKRTGLLKGELKGYTGKQKGTWSVGSGQKTVLKLDFKKAPDAEIELFINDEKVFANGVRHFVAYSDKCEAK